MKAINYYFDNTRRKLYNRIDISKTIEFTIKSHHKKIERINVILTTNENLYKINIDYLQHNTYTDIITFDYSEHGYISGDLYISCDMVCENAKKYEVSFQKEMERVIFHGVLHLLGYKDKSNEEQITMRKHENKALVKLGYFILQRRKNIVSHETFFN